MPGSIELAEFRSVGGLSCDLSATGGETEGRTGRKISGGGGTKSELAEVVSICQYSAARGSGRGASQTMARVSLRTAARVYGARIVRGTEGSAADSQWQNGPESVAAARGRGFRGAAL